ncbi:MAG TPA: cation diffusion facilitator family transporter [Bacteroidia bacterium]|nr:cation diffusion facilitator family transporter [Bacteroidia bacterium]
MNFRNLSEKDRHKVRSIALVLSISVLLLAIKFFAYFLTHSNAILTDALESIVNVVAGSFALYSIYYASQPKDENHPYGHGKIEFLSAGFEGGLIFIAGLTIIANSIYSLFLPPKIHSLESGVWLSAATGIVNLVMGKMLIKKGKAAQSMLLTANGKHLVSDTVSSIGLVAGLLIIWFTGILWLDQVIAIIFGVIILYTGYTLLRNSITSLLDEADTEKLVRLVEELQLKRQDRWIDIHNLRTIKYGSFLHVDCHITLPWYDSLEKTHEDVTEVERLIRESMGEDVEFFIHADPCIMPYSCKVCQIASCNYRQAPFEAKIEWKIDNVLPNKKHTVE